MPDLLLHYRDAAFTAVAATIAAVQIQDVLTAARSPWQNAYVALLSGRSAVSVSTT